MAEPFDSTAKPDVEAIMERIRAEVRRAEEKRSADHRFGAPSPFPRPPGRDYAASTGAFSPIRAREELRYLNDNWHSWVAPEEPRSHRKLAGRVVVRVKRFILDAVWEYLLKGYFERERQFQMNVVRFLNQIAHHVDERDADIFWQLVKKLDNDIVGVNQRTDRLFDDAAARFGRDIATAGGHGSTGLGGIERTRQSDERVASSPPARPPHESNAARRSPWQSN